MREPPSQFPQHAWAHGITPACAGTTPSCQLSSITRKDHPRVCGNHQHRRRQTGIWIGSPPRVREPQWRKAYTAAPIGITPACAGTTYMLTGREELIKDHPRVCGNHGRPAGACHALSGSPPRVREPQEPCREQDSPLGITPACAGTTKYGIAVTPTFEDHPRVCGNHLLLGRYYTDTSGSPPRVREPLDELVLHGNDAGITPACAGTTNRDDQLEPCQ